MRRCPIRERNHLPALLAPSFPPKIRLESESHRVAYGAWARVCSKGPRAGRYFADDVLTEATCRSALCWEVKTS